MRLPSETVAHLRRVYEGLRVCVTGGAGFIGGHLVDALVSMGATVNVIDDLSNSTLSHLGDLIELEPERVQFVHGSILDDDAVRQAVQESDVVFHLGALGSVPKSVQEPQRTWSVNTTGTLRVLEAARRGGSRRVVFAASSSAYGDDPALPKAETMLPRPMSPYAASKLAGEHLMLSFAQSYGLSTVSLRYFNIVGPRQAADSAYAAVVPAFIKAMLQGESPTIYGDGQQSRDFTPVDNAILATLQAGATQRTLTGEVINIGVGKRTTLLELHRLIAKAMENGSAPEPQFKPVRPGDVKHSVADISRARELIGYQPIVGLETALRDTVAWHRQGFASADRGDRGITS